MKMQTKHSFFLFITAFIWGTAFVAQSVGMDFLGPFTFNGTRTLMGGLVLLPFIWLTERRKPREQRRPLLPWKDKTLLKGGLLCGLLLAVASSFQQFGIQFTTVGKCGFITAFYIILVPIFGLFVKRRCPALTWVGVAVALAGLYLLCITESFTVSSGDLLVFCCAVLFSVHILVIDRYSPLVDGVRMSCLQFLVAGALCLALAFIFEEPCWADLLAAWKPLLYAGVFSCGVAYTLQVVGQNGVDPTVASLILSLESVLSVLAGWVILQETLSPRELLGCALVFAAILLVQVGPAMLSKRKKAAC